MAHLRYIKKDGKIYGPYSYKSIRTKDGKIKNIYLGKHQRVSRKNVVQKITFASAVIILLLMVLFFLKNQGIPIGLVVGQAEFDKNALDYKIEKTEEGYDIMIKEDSLNAYPGIILQGIKDPLQQITAKKGLSEDKEVKTEVFAIKEDLSFDNAILNLKKTGKVDYILHCQDFDFEKFECEDWEKTNIPFTNLGEYIRFEVPHFTAYAGGGTDDTSSNLTVWDDTDPEGGSNKRYSEGCQIPITCSSKVQTYFFANYTNNTGGENQPINDSGGANCSISFHLNLTSDDESSWTTHENMTFNHDTEQYEHNRSFNNRGVFYYNVSCWEFEPYDSDDNSTLDTVTISNSEPYIVEDPLPDLNCYEDSLCYFNFSDNCTDPDWNDAGSLTYNINDTSFSCMWFNATYGEILIDCTTDSDVFTGDFELTVSDSVAADAAVMRIIVSAVNDAPTFTLTDQTLNEDESWQINLSDYYSDEENNVPYFRENNTESGEPQFINISYEPTPPYTLNGEIINATPTNNEVGNYSLNITVNDTSGNEVSQIIVFEVVNVNDPPSLDWVCLDNDTNFTATEDTAFECTVNATDDDMNETWGTENLTFTANETWFTLEWQSNNESNVSFTPSDAQVGFWWINITVTDSESVTDSKLINITITNISDAPVLSEIGNFTVYTDVTYSFSINATDDDINIPESGEALNFTINDTTLFTLGDAYLQDNIFYSDISFTPPASEAGKFYWINFSVNDTDGFTRSELVNVSIRENSPPVLTATVDNNATEDIEFYINLTWNVTDPDGDEVTWADNTTLFDINSTTGEINFTANDSYVGEHWVNITITDIAMAKDSQDLNFTVYNVEDTPNFTEPIGNHTATEDEEFYLVINATDEDFYIPEDNIFGISENLTFAVNDTSLFDIIKDNETNATINFTATNDSQAGLYWFEINVTDTTGLVYNETINITIIAVNDAPQFIDFDNITGNQDVLIYYDFNASDEENGTDTVEGDGNLTFWIVNITNATDGDLIGSTTITRYFFDDADEALNSTTGWLRFTPNSTHAGTGIGYFDYLINLSVNDSDGAMDSIIINLSIKNENDPPVLNCVLLTASGFANNEVITMYENDTNMTFTIISVEDYDGDRLTFKWMLDNVVNKSNNVDSSGISAAGQPTYYNSWAYLPGFLDGGEHNLTLIITDGINESVDSWPGGSTTSCYRNITVLELNSPPEFILTIRNITWNQDTSYSNLNLDDHFIDVENGTTLNYTYDRFYENLTSLAENDSQITVSISSEYPHPVTFTPASRWYGMEYIQFHANDSIDNVSSNTVLLNVSEVEITPVVTTVPSAAAGGGVRKKLITIDIIHPGSLTLYKEELLVSPVIIRNTNNAITLRDIDIEAESLYGLQLELSETHIDQLRPGEEREVQLTVRGVVAGFEEITIRAIVHNPEVTDTAKIFATIVELPKELAEKIRFVKDLFKENPECLELNELVIKAEADLASNRYDDALAKINTAIEKCKDLISTVYRIREEEIPKRINIGRLLLLIGLNLFMVTFIGFVVNTLIKKRKRGIS